MENPGLTEVEAERLALIRYQLAALSEAIAAPPPINALAINLMQDVVEATLGAAIDHVPAKGLSSKPDFAQLFDAVNVALGAPAELEGLRPAAIAMNTARVGFKHHGNRVSDQTLRRHYDVAVSLVETIVDKAFHIRLADVSMLLFVRDVQVRGLIENAEGREKSGDLTGALWCLRLAFDLLVAEYKSRKSVTGWRSVFETKPSMYPSSSALEKSFGRTGRDHFEKLEEWVASLERLSILGALGIDLPRYAYFDAVAPKPAYFLGDVPAYPRVGFRDVTGDHVRASTLFVLDTAIRLGSNDYSLNESNRQIRRAHFDPSRIDEQDR